MAAVFEELRETTGLIIGLILVLILMGLIGYTLTNLRETIVTPMVKFIKKMFSRK